MRTYKHLSLVEREKYYALKAQGLSLREIGRRLGRFHTTLSREFRRNAKYGKPYIPCVAQRWSERRGERQRRKAPLKSPLVFLYVRKHLREDQWSPEIIAGRLPIDYPGNNVDDETIYRYIYLPRNHRFDYRQFLTLKRKKRMKKLGRKVRRLGKIPNAISIDLRSKSVLRRKKPGHWETDNMEGKRSDKTVLSITVERMARITMLAKLANRKSKTKTVALAGRLTTLPEVFRQTITEDNGAENTNHQQLTNATGMSVFFCHAYHSWEKGTVENTVGRIRRFFPKGESLDQISDQEIAAVEWKLNNTPRKCLQYLTPYEKMHKVLKRENEGK